MTSIMLDFKKTFSLFFSTEKKTNFLSFLSLTFVVGTRWKRLIETLPMSAQNICFHGVVK